MTGQFAAEITQTIFGDDIEVVPCINQDVARSLHEACQKKHQQANSKSQPVQFLSE